jgi:citrate lyase beta subunit
MLESYFFVPGDKKKFIEKSKELDASYIVFDLEDAVSIANKKASMLNLLDIEINSKSHFVRIPVFEDIYTSEEIILLTKHFNGNVVLPKVNSEDDILSFLNIVGNTTFINLILLIETPLGYINTKKILEKYAVIIHGIGFGSHDFSSFMRMKHTSVNLDFYRMNLVVLARAFEVKYIDSVNIDVFNIDQFEQEAIQAYNQGADGKFIIHPEQLNRFNGISYIGEDELHLYEKVYSIIKSIDDQNIDILQVEGRIYEKPHLATIKRYFEKKRRDGSK